MTTTIRRSAKVKTGLLALAILLGAASSCGQTSYFEVTVVTVSGAASDHFALNDAACDKPTGYNLGLFRYATDQDSGNVNFLVEIQDTSQKAVGQGSLAKSIVSGGIQKLTVAVTPDATALGCM